MSQVQIFNSAPSRGIGSDEFAFRAGSLRDGGEGAFGSLYGVDMSRINKAYDAQLNRVAELMHAYKNNDYRAKMAVESYMRGIESFANPSELVASKGERAQAAAINKVVSEVGNMRGIPQPMAAEFLHTMRDFPTLTLACVNRAFRRLDEQGVCETDCLDEIFYNQGARGYCEKRGKLGLLPIKAPSGAGCPHGAEDCDCKPAFWEFGETTRGDFESYFYRDGVKWAWNLNQCSQYGGWDDSILGWILRITNDRRQHLRASVLGNSSGINTAIFNTESDNIIKGTDGTCNPSVSCIADAIYVLEAFSKQWAYHRDNDGFRVCNRDLRIITLDRDTHCIFQKALEAEITETAELTALDGTCIKEVETTSSPCLQNMEVCYSSVMREVMGENADGVFFIAPVAGNEMDRNAFEEATIEGFENVQLFQKVPMWQTLGGRTVQSLGSDYCWNQEVMAVSSYGAGSSYPELAFASDGSGVDCA